jgi:6-phosphogluconolactonase (cycloisomerase 2 family)
LRRSIVALVAAAVVIVVVPGAPGAAAPAGALSQLSGRGGCLYDPDGGSAQGLHVDLPGRCGTAAALDGAHDALVSPDGRHLYVASFQGDSVSVFARDRARGRLTQPAGADACIVDDPLLGSRCGDAEGLDGIGGLGISPDGRHLYAASFGSGALASFARDRVSGRLTPLGCLADDDFFPIDCAPAVALYGLTSVTVSPDGRHVYATGALSHSIVVFARNRTSGALTQLPGAAGCIQANTVETEVPTGCATAPGIEGVGSVAVSPDGRHVYAASLRSASVAVFARNRSSGALTPAGCLSEVRAVGPCRAARALEGAFDVAVSPDGRNVYVSTGFDFRLDVDAFVTSGVAVFRRDRASGALRQLSGRSGCLHQVGSRAGCSDGRALEGATSLTISRDGRNVYVAAAVSNAVAILRRDRRTGALRQLAGRAGCVSETGTRGACRDVTGLWGASAVAVPPDGRHAYAAGFFSSAVAVFSRAAPPRR